MKSPIIDFSEVLLPGEEISPIYSNELYGLDVREGWYYITSYGRIFSASNWNGSGLREMTPTHAGDEGYLQIRLQKESVRGSGKPYRINRLVAYTFLECPGDPRNLDVNHKDCDIYNNNVDNLEWMTHRDNVHHAVNNSKMGSKFTKNDIIDIINRLNNGELCIDIAAIYNVSPSTITNIKNGITYRWITDTLEKNFEQEHHLTEIEIRNIYKLSKLKINDNSYATTYRVSPGTIAAIRTLQSPYDKIIGPGSLPIYDTNKKLEDEEALAMFGDFVNGMSLSEASKKYCVGESLAQDIKFLRNAYFYLREKYNLEPIDSRPCNTVLTDEEAIIIYKDCRDNHLRLKDIMDKYNIGESTANDVKLCRRRYQVLQDKYNLPPLVG